MESVISTRSSFMNQLPHASATTISLSMIERRIPCLNGQVALDKFISPQVCGDLVRCQGTLHPTGMIVIVKHRRFVSANDERAEEVPSAFVVAYCFVCADSYLACSSWAFYLVPT